jgi:hypothetical protein
MKLELILPIIIFVVWVLNHLLRNRENEEPVRPRAGNPAPNRGATNDIDRFLQEIDRLRRKGDERTEPAERPAPKPVVRTRPTVQTVPRARPVSQVREVQTVSPVVDVVAVVPPRQPFITPPPPPPVQRAAQVERMSSPAMSAAFNLLRSRQSLSAAVVLHEVLGPPKSRRR